jgi:hypothetical protein
VDQRPVSDAQGWAALSWRASWRARRHRSDLDGVVPRASYRPAVHVEHRVHGPLFLSPRTVGQPRVEHAAQAPGDRPDRRRATSPTGRSGDCDRHRPTRQQTAAGSPSCPDLGRRPRRCSGVNGRDAVEPGSGSFELRSDAEQKVLASSCRDGRRSAATPSWIGSPASSSARSLTTIGTPRNAPSGNTPAASCRARSYRSWMTAFNRGFTSSSPAMAASTSSDGETPPLRTSSA